MPTRLTNLLLLLLVVAEAATGILGWMLPEARAWPLYDLHRVLGVSLVLLLLWKQSVVRSSLARRLPRRPRDRSVILGALAGVALLASLGLGSAWTISLVSFDSFWGYSPLNLHVFLALGALPFVMWHMLRRWERRPGAKELVNRRSALRLVGLAVASTVAWQLVEGVANAWAPSGSRRHTGSKHAGSFSGNDMPVTIWLFDSIPVLDTSTWRLEVSGKVAQPAAFSYANLESLEPAEVTAVLDCTGGWWSEQTWKGVWVKDVLSACGLNPSAQALEAISVTGHRWTFPLSDLQDAVLATHVGGELLNPGHGYPVRLVAPGRRGFQWIKWVGRLEAI